MRTFFVLALVGCTSPPPERPGGEEPTRAAKLEPVPSELSDRRCDVDVSLYGASGSATSTLVPFSIDSGGVNVCLELDARDNLVVAHFAATTQYEVNATTSMFVMTLVDKGGNPLQQSWDVTFGSAPPTTFANLEFGVTKGTVLEATLHIDAKCVPIGSDVKLALFEPYE